MANQVDSTNIVGLLQEVFTKIKNAFWAKGDTSQLPIDNTPTSGSNNLVESGGVYSALTAKYEKPSSGIPASDIANGVIPSAPGTLDTTATTAQSTSASEALSGNVTLHKVSKTGSYNDLLNKPTIPAAQVNADWNASSGVAQILNKPTIPAISTDIETDKASDTKTASPKAVYDEVHPAVGSSQPAGGMLPNVFYDLGTLSGDTTFAFATASDNTIKNEWMFEFTTPSTAPTITWPNAITGWSGGTAPTINASKTYQVSVLNGLGVIAEF